jgi:transposase
MAGVTSIIIKESAEELEKLLKKEKEAKNKERIQALYWLKQEKAPTITEIAKSLGRNRATVQKWLTKYREEKLEGLLKRKKSEGRVRVIPKWAEESLRKKLTEKEGFRSYKEVQK